MKKTLLILAIAVLACNVNAATKTTDMVVATVNKQAITLQELKNRITLSKLLINKKLSKLEFDVLKNQAIDQLVKEELMRQYAESKKITVSSTDLKAAIAFIEQQRKLAPGTLFDKIPENLRPTATDQIKNSILDKQVVQKIIVKRVFVPEYEVQNLLDNVLSQAHSKEYKISQILISKSKNQQQDARKIGKIYEQLISGDKFENMVAAFSDGPNKLSGGSLGWFTLNELNFKLQKAVKKLSKGDFSQPVKGQNGWFIVKVEDIKITENIDTTETDEFKYISFSAKLVSKQNAKKIKEMMKAVNGYTDFKNFKKQVQEKYSLKVTEVNDWVILKDVKVSLKEPLEKTLPGNFSPIIQNKDKSLEFIYVVDKQVRLSEQVLKIKQRIERNLQGQKAERKFKKLQKELRAKAFVELR